METFTASTFATSVLDSPIPVLVEFTAPWCGPCRQLEPILADLAREWAGKIVIGKVDIDEYPDIAMRYQVLSIPTLILIQRGEVRARLQGFRAKSVVQKTFAPFLAG